MFQTLLPGQSSLPLLYTLPNSSNGITLGVWISPAGGRHRRRETNGRQEKEKPWIPIKMENVYKPELEQIAMANLNLSELEPLINKATL